MGNSIRDGAGSHALAFRPDRVWVHAVARPMIGGDVLRTLDFALVNVLNLSTERRFSDSIASGRSSTRLGRSPVAGFGSIGEQAESGRMDNVYETRCRGRI